MITTKDLWEEIEVPRRLKMDCAILNQQEVIIEEWHELYDEDDED